jgi:hypothetical protein
MDRLIHFEDQWMSKIRPLCVGTHSEWTEQGLVTQDEPTFKKYYNTLKQACSKAMAKITSPGIGALCSSMLYDYTPTLERNLKRLNDMLSTHAALFSKDTLLKLTEQSRADELRTILNQLRPEEQTEQDQAAAVALYIRIRPIIECIIPQLPLKTNRA